MLTWLPKERLSYWGIRQLGAVFLGAAIPRTIIHIANRTDLAFRLTTVDWVWVSAGADVIKAIKSRASAIKSRVSGGAKDLAYNQWRDQ